MHYLDNIFSYKIEPHQRAEINKFLSESEPTEAVAYLSVTRFKVESYFWLTGPFVYLEIELWAIFGVLSSLLFNFGVISKNATTDLANPQSTFDASEIPFQAAKILYAPVCTLAVVLGYNFFKDENIVDISSSKGVITFAFICGFYSSRLIALMDRLKDVLLPNNGTATLPVNTASALATQINQLLVKVNIDPAILTQQESEAMGTDWLNNTEVFLSSVNNQETKKGDRLSTDPVGVFTFKNLMPGNYNITAAYHKDDAGIDVDLSAEVTGPINSGIAPIELNLKRK